MSKPKHGDEFTCRFCGETIRLIGRIWIHWPRPRVPNYSNSGMRLHEAIPIAEDFTPYCHFSSQADALTAYFEGEADYSERVNEQITLYRSLNDNRVVGCRIKGVRGIIACKTPA